MTVGDKQKIGAHLPTNRWFAFLGFLFVSFIYFADITMRASQKYFWFDELATVYLCRLSSFGSIWTAVLHGADFNPPFGYLITWLTERLLGEGLIATRLPEMIGVWLFGVCLYVFVSRRVGWLGGFIAGTLPFFTLIQYYSYEARPHGLVLGWCGLALVCWQQIKETSGQYLWIAGFVSALVGAILTHVYAIYILFPFVLVELYGLTRRERISWHILLAIGSSAAVAIVVYIPLIRAYHSVVVGDFSAPSHATLQLFLMRVLGPSLAICLLALIAIGSEGSSKPASGGISLSLDERVLAIGFCLLPAMGLAGAKLSHGPFFDRYFLSTVAGYAILLAAGCTVRSSSGSTAKIVAGFILLLMLGNLGAAWWTHNHGEFSLAEPSSGFRLGTVRGNPMAHYQLIANDDGRADIVLPWLLDYLYLYEYAPLTMRSRLYYCYREGDEGEFAQGEFAALNKWAGLNLKTETFRKFLATHDNFQVYGAANDPELMHLFRESGFKLQSARTDKNHMLYEFAK